MIDYFASQDIEEDGETLADWLARKLHVSPAQASARLAAMQRVRATLASADTTQQPTDGRAAA